jgi:hypothetical protein
MSIFDYARNKIHKEYSSRWDYSYDDVKRLENRNLDYIDWYEEESTQGIKNAIACRIKTFWKAQTGNEQLFIGATISVICLALLAGLLWSDDTLVNIIILKISQILFGYFIVLCGVWLYRIFRRDFIKRKVFYLVWIAVLLLSIPHVPQLFGYKTTQIGDFYEALKYTEEYYVIYSKEPQSNPNRKQYVLPARIERRLDYTDTTENGYDKHDLNYHINYLYFSNGGYLSFDYDIAYDTNRSLVILGQETEVEDYHGDTYYITLTDEKVNRG